MRRRWRALPRCLGIFAQSLSCYAGHEGGCLAKAVRKRSFHYGAKLCRCYERGFRSEASTLRIWFLRVSGGSLYSSRGDDFLMIFRRIYNFWRRWDHSILVPLFRWFRRLDIGFTISGINYRVVLP